MKRFRFPGFERLESRQLLASDCGYHNSFTPEDVDEDRVVSAIDALVVINELNVGNIGPICNAQSNSPSGEANSNAPISKIDVDDDGNLTPLDALLVINEINFQTAQASVSAASTSSFSAQLSPVESLGPAALLTAQEVEVLLKRASQISSSRDGIFAVVDRSGRILGVHVESGVSANITADPDKLAFAIDGAVAKARTAAFFSNNEAPLTSRTIRFISQSTMTQREVESSPINSDPRYVGPGFVAPIGVGGHFPPETAFTPQVDLFAIEHQSRDSQLLNGLDGMRGTVDDLKLLTRFNVDPTSIAPGAEDFFKTWPESYGIASGTSPRAQSRGIATLPGGMPLYKLVNGTIPNLVGGIGVFFPGEDGYATYEQNFYHQSELGGAIQTETQRLNAPRVLEAEAIAFFAASSAGIVGPFATPFVSDLIAMNSKLPYLPNFISITGRIDLVGITLEIYGPTPTTTNPFTGLETLFNISKFLQTDIDTGTPQKVTPGNTLYLAGQAVPERWLVMPTDSSDGSIAAWQVEQMINQAVAQANITRAAIRLDANFRPGARTKMVISVADTNGKVLGIYRMPDATIFSIDVSVAKARNTAYYADATALQPADRVDFNSDGIFGAYSTTTVGGDSLPLGVALTNRTFRFLAEPRYPTGIELPSYAADFLQNLPDYGLADQNPFISQMVGPHSMLQLPGINPKTGENLDNNNPLNVTIYNNKTHSSTVAFDAFNPSRNFRDEGDAGVVIAGTNIPYKYANQNGVVFFPGSTPLYVNFTKLAGGLGVSGDGVDQDDVVTVFGQAGYDAPAGARVDNFAIGGVRLPFQKFNRNPNGT